MSKVNVGLVTAVIICFMLNVFQVFYWLSMYKKTAATYTTEIATLEETIAGYGSKMDCWTVSTAVKQGDPITMDNLTTMTIYSSLLTDQYVLEPERIVGKYFKIAVNPGTPVFYGSVMEENIDDTARDRDIMLDRMTVGMKVGDYIDIRMTMPYGDDYVVLSHKRIVDINDSTIKLYLSELEWNTYLGALVDYYLNAQYGCTIYADRYIEPGLQQSAVAFYAVPANIAALLQKNPNIVDKEGASQLNEWRAAIEELLVIFRDDDDTVDSDGATLAAGREDFNKSVETDRGNYDDTHEQVDAATGANDTLPDDFWD